jgi:hypothetical protein
MRRLTAYIGLGEDLEAAQRAGEMLHINVLGLATIGQDVTPDLARATIASVSVLGALHATPAVKAALADRTRRCDAESEYSSRGHSSRRAGTGLALRLDPVVADTCEASDGLQVERLSGTIPPKGAGKPDAATGGAGRSQANLNRFAGAALLLPGADCHQWRF